MEVIPSSGLFLITMEYAQAVEYIESLGIFGIKPGLERMEYLLNELGNPQSTLNCIHVAGTNGKGSVCSMLEAMLSGYKTGKFTSPHLVCYNERFAINGKIISNDDLAKLVDKVRPIVEQMPDELRPTQFELLTAMAFLYFSEQSVDYAIIEVGLGGLLDSTNIITPRISVITNVDMDHMDKCGNTLAEIAAHKAGIIKNNVPVITAATGEALRVIHQKAQACNSLCLSYGRDFAIIDSAYKATAQQLLFALSNGTKIKTSTMLLGEHQLLNAAVALMTIVELLGVERSEQAAAKLIKARWPGRLELVAQGPAVILDGAHNLAGAKVLRNTLDELFANKKICFILGFMQDKDIIGIVDILIKDQDCVIPIVADPNYPRSASAEYIATLLITKGHNVIEETAFTLAQAIAKAKELVGSEGVVCIAGSLYLIGRVKQEKVF